MLAYESDARLNSCGPRTDSVAWTLIDVMPAHPMISVPVAGTSRTKAVVNEALQHLQAAGVVTRASHGNATAPGRRLARWTSSPT